jgi:opacity protein-like surface antigen
MLHRALALAVVAVCGLGVAPASAQIAGWFTPHVGLVAGGDTTANGATFGVSMAAFEYDAWLGAEVDFAHVTEFNDEQFQDSGITTLMVNAIAAPHRRKIAPYLLGGVGLMRVRGCVQNCVRTVSRTEMALDGGVGVQYRMTDLFAVRGELRYFRLVESGESVPRTSSGAFDYFRWMIGGTLTWAQK